MMIEAQKEILRICEIFFCFDVKSKIERAVAEV